MPDPAFTTDDILQYYGFGDQSHRRPIRDLSAIDVAKDRHKDMASRREFDARTDWFAGRLAQGVGGVLGGLGVGTSLLGQPGIGMPLAGLGVSFFNGSPKFFKRASATRSRASALEDLQRKLHGGAASLPLGAFVPTEGDR